MTEPTKDLWPSDFGKPEVRLPLVILKEQASLLGEKTGHLVEAEVKTTLDEDAHLTVAHAFYLVAPTLDNYRYRLFRIGHEASSFYPLFLSLEGDYSKKERINSEPELLNKLAQIFNAPETKRIIQNLIAQAQAA